MDQQNTQQDNANFQESDYQSISAAAKQYGISQSVIRQGMRSGKVQSVNHKWGTRVLSSDVEQLKASRAHLMGGNASNNEVH